MRGKIVFCKKQNTMKSLFFGNFFRKKYYYEFLVFAEKAKRSEKKVRIFKEKYRSFV